MLLANKLIKFLVNTYKKRMQILGDMNFSVTIKFSRKSIVPRYFPCPLILFNIPLRAKTPSEKHTELPYLTSLTNDVSNNVSSGDHRSQLHL